MRPTKYGSMERYLLGLTRAAERAGFATVIQYDAAPESVDFTRDLRQAGARLVIADSSARKAGSIGNAVALIASVRPSVVHFHFAPRHVVLLGATAARLSGARTVIAMVHNVHHLTARSHAKWAYNRCDWVLAVSDAVRNDLVSGRVRPERLRTHYMGIVDPPAPDPVARRELRARLGLRDSTLVLGNIAFDAPFKGVDILVEAVESLVSAGHDVALVQIGVDPDASALAKSARASGIADRVRWIGIIDRGAEMLNAADIYVQPSRFGEGLPLAILEAMAIGLPVIATRVAGNPEAVMDGETGVLVDPGDAAGIASAVTTALADPGVRRRLGAAGRERFLALFDGERSAAELVQRYY